MEESGKYARRMKVIETLLSNWWDKKFLQVFNSLVPFKKCKYVHANLRHRDILLLMNNRKVGVTEVLLYDKSLVRAAKVVMRPHDN